MRRRGFNGNVRRRGPGARRVGGPGASDRRAGAGRHFRPAAAPAASASRAPLDGGVIASSTLLVSLGSVMVYSTTAPLAIGHTLPPHFVRHLFVTALALTIAALAVRVPRRLARAALPLWGFSVLLLLRRWSWATPRTARSAAARAAPASPSSRSSSQNGRPCWWSDALARYRARDGGPAAGAQRPPLRAPPILAAASAGLRQRAGAGRARRAAALLRRHPDAFHRPAVLSVAGAALYVFLRARARARHLDPGTRRPRASRAVLRHFGRGELLGVGLGDGRQKLFYLPEAHTDFILSVVAEELGLAGVLVVLGAFAAFIVAGARIARRARDPFALLTAFGMTALVALPAIVNAAVVMGLAPTKGFTLPFLSYGGNSLLVCALAVGILLRLGSVEAAPEARRIGAAASRSWTG
jgi:hypothetical protein